MGAPAARRLFGFPRKCLNFLIALSVFKRVMTEEQINGFKESKRMRPKQ